MIAVLSVLPITLLAIAAPLSVWAGNILAGATLAWALGRTIKNGVRTISLPPKSVLLAVGALLLTQTLATVLAPGAPRWDKLVEENWFKLLLVAIPVVLGSRGDIARRCLWLALAAGTAAALYGLYQHFADHDPIRGRLLHFQGGAIAQGFTNHHLSFGGQLVTLMALALCWMREDLLNHWQRGWRPALVCLVMGLALIYSYARSAQVGVFLMAVYLVTTLPGRWRRVGLAGLASVVLLAVAMPAVRERVAESFTDEKEVTRPNLWQSSVAGIAARPLVGWGPGNFAVMMEEHEVPGFYESQAHSHNDFLMHAVNAGLLGLAAALWLLVAVTRACHTGWRRGGPGSWMLLGGVAAQIGISVAGIFQVFQTDDESEILLYLVLGCCLALLNALSTNQAPGDTTPKLNKSP